MDSRQRGFTVLELLVTVVIVSLILGLAVPNLTQFIRNNRITGIANDLLVAMHTARTESIKRHSQTVVCFTSDPDAAQPPCDGDGTQGWIVFVDDADPAVAAATDNNVEVDPGEPVVLRHSAIHDSVSFNSLPAGNAGYLAYNAAGFSREIAAVGADIASVVMCDSRGNVAVYGANDSAARAVFVSATGRAAVTRSVANITGLGGCP